MKVEELFTGAWVEYKGTPHKILGIHKDDGGDYRCQIDDEFKQWYLLSEFKPIPITDELLEKIGFNYMQHKFGGDYMLFDFLGVFIKTDGDCWKFDCNRNGLFMFKLHFVHELQMALTLNGIDKEIML